MTRNAALLLWLAGTVLVISAGCANGPVDDASARSYRTVQATPGRDTEAARRANQKGLAHLERGDLEQAARAFHRALADDVEFGPAHNNLGKVYYRQEKWYEAAWEFEYARKLMPKASAPHNNLGLVLEQGDELDQAIERYQQAIQLDPHKIEYRANLARAMVRRGDRTKEVRRLLKQIIEQDSRSKWLTWARRQLAAMGGEK